MDPIIQPKVEKSLDSMQPVNSQPLQHEPKNFYLPADQMNRFLEANCDCI